MSRARIVSSQIVNKMTSVQHFDDKLYSNLNSSQSKEFNRCFNESSSGANTNVHSELSEINTSIDDWLPQKTTCSSMDCIDSTYLNDLNFLATRDSDMCSSDVGLELILVDNEKRESNLNFCTINDKNSDLDFPDPLLNLLPMNDELLRKTDLKCDNLVSGKDLYVSEGNKSRSAWDTLSITSCKSDCDVENSSDFADFNLLPLSFDSNDHIIEPLTENNVKTQSNLKLANNKLDLTNSEVIIEKIIPNTTVPNNTVESKISVLSTIRNTNSKKAVNTKRPNILRTTKNQTFNSKTIDQNMNVDLLSPLSDSVFNFINNGNEIVPASNSDLLSLLPDDFNSTVPLALSDEFLIEENRVRRKYNTFELSKLQGCIASVSRTDDKTRVTIKAEYGGIKWYEGNTSELSETVGTNRKRRPGIPVEGDHIIINIKTAITIRENEPDDKLVHDMLSVLGITNDMLYIIITNLSMRIWLCPEDECCRIFNRLNTLKTHILSHYGLKPFKCDFPNCPWSFFTSFKLKRHRETHLKRKDFMCTIPDCNRSFTTVYNLNTHLKLHERPALLKCVVRTCPLQFQTRRAMEMHLKTHELSLAPYKCVTKGCDKLYYSMNALTAHMRCHQHKEEELQCQWENCGRRFDKPCRLKAHMRTHTGDKPYVCRYQDCHWAFTSASKLKRHQYKHNNERKFRCTIGDCTKAFMRSEHLREHTYTHIAQRSFRCSICGETCSAKASLYVHRKKFHPNEKCKSKDVQETLVHKSSPTSFHQETMLSKTDSETDDAAFLITLLADEKKETLSSNATQIVFQDIDGKQYEIDLNGDIVERTDKLKENMKVSEETSKNILETNCSSPIVFQDVDGKAYEFNSERQLITFGAVNKQKVIRNLKPESKKTENNNSAHVGSIVVEDLEGNKYEIDLGNQPFLSPPVRCKTNKSKREHEKSNVTVEKQIITSSTIRYNSEKSEEECPKLIINSKKQIPTSKFVTSSSNKSKVIRKLKEKSKSCARTYLPYEFKYREKKINVSDIVTLTNTNTNIAEEVKTAPIVLDSNTMQTEDILQTVYLSNLMLQDDPGSVTVSDDIYSQIDDTEYILLFDPNTDTNIPESTVNLKDLD